MSLNWCCGNARHFFVGDFFVLSGGCLVLVVVSLLCGVGRATLGGAFGALFLVFFVCGNTRHFSVGYFFSILSGVFVLVVVWLFCGVGRVYIGQ